MTGPPLVYKIVAVLRVGRNNLAAPRAVGVRASRRALRALLSMRKTFDGIKKAPHPEEAAKRPSRRTHLRSSTLSQSVPFFLVDDIEQRLTGGKAPAVFEEDRFPFLA